MPVRNSPSFLPGRINRRGAIQAGALGLMGLGMADVAAWREASGSELAPQKPPARSIIFVFLTGGLSHQDSFDLKPYAPDTVRGEFRPIATKTPDIQISEHLPSLAQRSDLFALCRSVETASSSHGPACHMLLTGRLDLPAGFNPGGPGPQDWPSIPAMVTYATKGHRNLPPAIVLPQPSINEAGKVRPGQYAGKLGKKHEAWHIDIAAQCALGNGPCPECFRFEGTPFEHGSPNIFNTPTLTLPDGDEGRFRRRVGLLQNIEQQRVDLETRAETLDLDKHRQQAISVLADPKTSLAFDVANADPKTLERYGKNKFGMSLLMAYRLVDAGVNLVQVNLGKNSSWDTHRRNFVNLKDNLLPHTDRGLSALLDDLRQSGLLESTLVVVSGEFGRTPTINKDAGRDHWGPLMSVFFAGGGVQGGTVIGASDKLAAYPVEQKQTTENLAATMYDTLGIPHHAQWVDVDGRPHEVYKAAPIPGLFV